MRIADRNGTEFDLRAVDLERVGRRLLTQVHGQRAWIEVGYAHVDGHQTIVAHLGVRKALGDEAARAIDLGLRLARTQASVGVATGRTRIDRTRPQGEVVDRAAALARDAQRGQVLVDTTTSELARAVTIAQDGTVYVGTGAGAAVWDGKAWSFPPALQFEINDLVATHNGQVWMATERGIAAWDGKKVRRVDTRRGLAENSRRFADKIREI